LSCGKKEKEKKNKNKNKKKKAPEDEEIKHNEEEEEDDISITKAPHPNTPLLNSYMELWKSQFEDEESSSQSLPDIDNSISRINLPVDVNNPTVVVEKLLSGASGTDAVMVINVHMNSILLFYTAFIMFFLF